MKIFRIIDVPLVLTYSTNFHFRFFLCCSERVNACVMLLWMFCNSTFNRLSMLGAINFTSLGSSNCVLDVIANVPYVYCTMGVLGLRNGCLQILTFVCIGKETTLSKGQAILFSPVICYRENAQTIEETRLLEARSGKAGESEH